jgi:microcystin-dependent protein
MGTPYLAEIRIVSFNFAPKGWALCNGQSLPINQNQALFSILGTTYGGNGQTTFNLPNLQGRVPLHTGGSFLLGQSAGEDGHTLSGGEASHTHAALANPAVTDQASPAGHFWANAGLSNFANTPNTLMAATALSTVGGGQPHENRSPFLVLSFVIALAGIFPSRN